MKPRTKTRFGISALVYTLVNAVMFGTGLIVVLTIPVLRENLALSIAVVVVASFVFAAPVAWLMAPWLRARNWNRERAIKAH